MPELRRILMDETLFVFLTRNDGDFELKPQLGRFMEKCRKANPHREYRVFSTKGVRRRLGYGWSYNACKNTFTRSTQKKGFYQKRLERRELAKKVIIQFLRRKRWRLKPYAWTLMDIHLFANENKRQALNRPLKPNEVISLDICENAIIAHECKIPIFSFNENYEYLMTIPGAKSSFMEYWKPEDILKQMSV